MLSHLGCRVSVAASVAQALELAAGPEAGAARVAIVDWKLPDGDGFELARRLQVGGDGSRRAVILATSYGDEEIAERVAREGLAGFLAKPFSSATLVETLRRALGAVPAAPRRPDGPGDGSGAAGQLRGRSVLLVEDNELNQLVAHDLLDSVCGMRVTIAGNGQEALEQLQRARFDAVLMDVQMPGMDGYEATRRIRTMDELAALPVIAMTAHATPWDRERCLQAGMNDYVTKPVDPERLVATLLHWIQGAAMAPGAAPEAPPAGGVDFAAGLKRCLGKAELYRKIARRFLDTQSGLPDALQGTLAAGELQQAHLLAHSLVSTSALLGADAMSQRARELEATLASGSKEAMNLALAALRLEHAAVLAALARHLDAESATA